MGACDIPVTVNRCMRLSMCGFWAGGWHRLHVQGKELVVVPNLVTGCKIWHLREKGSFYPKTAWANTVASLPDGAWV